MSLLQVNFHEALRSLWGTRQRSLLALIGIVIGIGSVIGMVSIGTIVQQQSMRQFNEMGVDIVTMRMAQGGREEELPLDLLLRLPEAIGNVLVVAPYTTYGSEYSQAGRQMFIQQMGVTAGFFALNKLRLAEGRGLSDLDQNRYFCVVGAELAELLRKAQRGTLLGRQIPVDERIYTIVGALEKTAEGGLRPYGINRAVIVPITTSRRAFSRSTLGTAMARLAPHAPLTETKGEIQRYFRQKAGGTSVEITAAEDLIESMRKQMRLFSLLLAAIGSISLIVGGIGVMNVMLIAVNERRSEIGLRRALGAQRGDIQSQFLIESVLLCLAGGAIGIGLGIGASYLFAHFSKWTFFISSWAIFLGVGVSTVIGIFCGFYPARAAARIDPIKALRS